MVGAAIHRQYPLRGSTAISRREDRLSSLRRVGLARRKCEASRVLVVFEASRDGDRSQPLTHELLVESGASRQLRSGRRSVGRQIFEQTVMLTDAHQDLQQSVLRRL